MKIRIPLHALVLASLLAASLTSCGLPTALPNTGPETPEGQTATVTVLTPTAIRTATPLPTPSPTPIPAARVQSGDEALFLGDYELAMREYQTAADTAADEQVQAAARVGMARVYLAQKNPSAALPILRAVVEARPNNPILGWADYLLGTTYHQLQRYDEAAEAYRAYITERPGLLDDYVQDDIGNVLSDAGNYAGAAEAYQAALDALSSGSGEWLEIKIAKAVEASGDLDSALNRYSRIYTETTSDYTRASMDWLIGQVYLDKDMAEEAYVHFSDTVKKFPRASESYLALVELVDAGIPVSDLDRGIVDYYAGEYSLAIEALDRFINDNPDHDGTPHYYKALALMSVSQQKAAIGSPERTSYNVQGGLAEDHQAVAELDMLIRDHATDSRWPDAWDEKAYVQSALQDQPALAGDTLDQFVTNVPSHPRSPDFLFMAGRYYERANQLEDAAATWGRFADEYPASSQTFRGLFFAGISYFRLEEFDLARTTFQRAQLLAEQPEDKAAANLWVGKTYQSQGSSAQAKEAWTSASELDPTGYYSERARDLLLDRSSFAASSEANLGVDLDSEWGAAESWMRTTFNLPPEIDLSSPGALASDLRFRRGSEFWSLGLYADGKREFEALRESLAGDPSNSFRLLPALLDLGLYRTAVLTSRQILTQAGLDDAATLNAPDYFNHIRFGIYYRDLVVKAAHEEDVDPLLLLAMMRQESMFEGFVQSSAGAQGLMQIMPGTGESIARQMGWPDDFTAQDLTRPVVSIAMGAHYVAQQRRAFDNDPYAMLAAYNAGPGNAAAWLQIAPDDPDLFLEVIRIQETRTYIMHIYEFYNLYRGLYGASG